MTSDSPPRLVARRLLRQLGKGTTIAEGARYLHVGHARWLEAQRELLDELEEDGGSDTKFVRGTYGSGKSHFLYVVEDIARQSNWLTAHVECKADDVQIDRFETLYPALCRKLRVSSDNPEDDVDPVSIVLGTWFERMCLDAGLAAHATALPFDAAERLYAQLDRTLLRSNLPVTFQKALTAFVMAKIARRLDVVSAVVDWVRGSDQRVRIDARYLHPTLGNAKPGATRTFDLRPLGKGTAREALRSLLWLIRKAGHTGLVLSIDEVEELARLPQRRRRDQALQALREHVDDAGAEGGHRSLCLYLAATPEMFENQDYFPRYDALQTRIQPIGRELNWRAPVIDLDRTPLSGSEMQELASHLRDLYGIAYEARPGKRVTEAVLNTFVKQVSGTTLGIAKPRLLVRLVVHELERARQRDTSYRPPDDITQRLIQLESS